MFKIENNNIYMTRGETLKIKLESDTDIFFPTTTTITFSIMEKGKASESIKTVSKTLGSECTDAKSYTLVIDADVTSGTEFEEFDNGIKSYWYEIKLSKTIGEESEVMILVGYDSKGPKFLYMYPNAGPTPTPTVTARYYNYYEE